MLFAEAAEQLATALREPALESIGDSELRRRAFAIGIIIDSARRDEAEACRPLYIQHTSRVGACGNRGLWRTIVDRTEARES